MANSKVRTSAGTTLSVSAAIPTSLDATGYSAVAWTAVGELTDLGSFGKKYNVVKFTPLADRKTVKRKGSYDNGTLALKMGSVPSDGGQVLLQAGADSDNSYSFKVVTQGLNTYYFTGQITDFTINVGSVDQITGADCNVEIDNDIVFVAATGA